MNYKCDQLAGALERCRAPESGSKLRALQTLRAVWLRTGMSALRNQCGCPEGTHDNSPALQCWGEGASTKRPEPGGEGGGLRRSKAPAPEPAAPPGLG